MVRRHDERTLRQRPKRKITATSGILIHERLHHPLGIEVEPFGTVKGLLWYYYDQRKREL
jgi:hypothetical protein